MIGLRSVQHLWRSRKTRVFTFLAAFLSGHTESSHAASFPLLTNATSPVLPLGQTLSFCCLFAKPSLLPYYPRQCSFPAQCPSLYGEKISLLPSAVHFVQSMFRFVHTVRRASMPEKKNRRHEPILKFRRVSSVHLTQIREYATIVT